MIDDTPWDRRVRFARDRSGRAFAYRPDQLVTTREGLQALCALGDGGWNRTPVESPAERERDTKRAGDAPFDDDPLQGPLARDDDRIGGRLFLARGVPDPVGSARLLRARGIPAQVNHVAFAAAVGAGSGATGFSSSNGLGSPAARWASNGLGSPAAQWASNGLGSPAAWWASNGLGSPGPLALSCVPVPVGAPCSCGGADRGPQVPPPRPAPPPPSPPPP